MLFGILHLTGKLGRNKMKTMRGPNKTSSRVANDALAGLWSVAVVATAATPKSPRRATTNLHERRLFVCLQAELGDIRYTQVPLL